MPRMKSMIEIEKVYEFQQNLYPYEKLRFSMMMLEDTFSNIIKQLQYMSSNFS